MEKHEEAEGRRGGAAWAEVDRKEHEGKEWSSAPPMLMTAMVGSSPRAVGSAEARATMLYS